MGRSASVVAIFGIVLLVCVSALVAGPDVAAAASLVSGTSASQRLARQDQASTVSLNTKDGIGTFLTDGAGMTLYYYPLDVAGDSKCTGGCLRAWPVFYSDALVVAPELDPSDFGTITRSDGDSQTTFKGWPLYYFARDVASGDTNGEGVGNVWYVMKVPVYTVMVANKSEVSSYLVDIGGRAVYTFTRDVPGAGTSNCTGPCINNWPAFSAGEVIAPSLLESPDFGAITLGDGSTQTTYKGWPLYYYLPDVTRGDTKGQGVGGIWFVAATPPPPAPAATPTATGPPPPLPPSGY